MKNDFLVPVIVKDIAEQFNPNNPHTSQNEKFQAEGRLRAIIEFCEKSLLVTKTPQKKK